MDENKGLKKGGSNKVLVECFLKITSGCVHTGANK